MVQRRPVIYAVASLLIALFGASGAQAEVLIPLDLNGSVSYTYSYAETGNIQAEASTITASGAATGYVWQPWFMEVGAGLNIGLSKSGSNTGSSGTASTAESGNFSFSVFPQSRFPFYLAYARTDSLIENTDITSPLETRFKSENILLTQSYYAPSGSFSMFTWNHHIFDSGDEKFDVDALNASFRMRHQYHRISAAASYIESGREKTSDRPYSLNLSADHAYLPGNELSVTSLVSQNTNNNDSSDSPAESRVAQASSSFSWRPDHKSYSIIGSALLSHTESLPDGGVADRFSTAGGITYRYSNRLSMTTNVFATLSDNAGEQTSQEGVSANLIYASQQYVFAGFNYSFSAGGGVSKSWVDTKQDAGVVVPVDENRPNSTSENASFGHSAAQAWSVGSASSVSVGLSQSIGVSDSTDAVASVSFGQGVNLGWNTRGEDGSTFANLNFNDSRSCNPSNKTADVNSESSSDPRSALCINNYKTKNQLVNAQISRNQTLSRVSNFVANMTYQVSTLKINEAGQVDDKSQSTTAQVTYRNSKAFGVFRLRLESNLSYSEQVNESDVGAGGGTSKFNVKFGYNIGKLSTSLGFNVSRNVAGTESYGMNFGATRTF